MVTCLSPRSNRELLKALAQGRASSLLCFSRFTLAMLGTTNRNLELTTIVLFGYQGWKRVHAGWGRGSHPRSWGRERVWTAPSRVGALHLF